MFGRLEIVGKVQQITSLVLYWGVGATRRGFEGVADPARVAHSLCGVALIAAGQALNGAVYKAIGEAGVYYGFKLGETGRGARASLAGRAPAVRRRRSPSSASRSRSLRIVLRADNAHAFLVWASLHCHVAHGLGDNDSEPTKKESSMGDAPSSRAACNGRPIVRIEYRGLELARAASCTDAPRVYS